MKKGKEWALSCVAVSALVLTGMSATTVHADTVNSSETPSTTIKVQNAARTANHQVKDGGNVEDDLPDASKNDLGYASYFHIFAKEATLNAHTNGNVAVQNLTGNVNFGTNTHENLVDQDISYIQHINKIANSSFVSSGDTRSNKVVFGEGIPIDVSQEDRPLVNDTYIDHLLSHEVYQDKNGNTYIDFDKYFSQLEGKSDQLANKEPQVSAENSDFPDRNNRVINLEKYQPNENNQIIINLDGDVLKADTPLTIFGLSKDAGGTNVVINVDTKGEPNYTINSQIKLIYNDGSAKHPEERPNQETEYFDDNHLLWNFTDSTKSDNLYDGIINVDRPFQGSVLAPKATVNANQNLDGNIIAEQVNVNSETHRWDYQNNTGNETEYPDFERPIIIPGELPDLPGEEDNNGGNIENPDEDKEEEDIDPDTGDLVDPDDEDEDDNDTGDTTDPDGSGDSDDEDEDEDDNDTGDITDPDGSGESKDDEDKDLIKPGTDTDDDQTNDSDEDGNHNLITNGGSEGNNSGSNESDQPSNGNLSEGNLAGVVGNNKDESQTPGTIGTLPQTGETSGIIATITGLILVVFGFLLKMIRIKKD